MDPFAAIGLAGNIVTFIDFAVKLVSKTSEVYRSATGETEAQRALKIITTDLDSISKRLSAPLPESCSGPEKELADLASDCKREAESLLSILAALSRPVKGRLPAAKVVLNTFLRKKEEVEERSKKLAEFRSALVLRLVSLTNDQNSSISKLLWDLTQASSTMSADTSNRLDKLQATVEHLRSVIVKASRDVNGHDEDLAAVTSTMRWIQRLGDPLAREQLILKGLEYDSMLMRRSGVVKAHMQTYEWIFSRDSNFRRWLSHGNEVFWISGKPGSGKSTLMKFLFYHPSTNAFLESWAKGHDLITASFYFWSSGTEMEKSLQGLFQSLLFEIMRQCPSIIRILCPKRWINAFSTPAQEPWAWDEIKASFDKVSQQRNMATKFCFFIDGLDEYGGEHAEMLELLLKASKSSNMKMCLASRPENIFQSALGQHKDKMFRLQDLTRDDIRLYAKDKLNSHQSLLRLRTTKQQYEPLVEDIVDKADGVFLWVTLVVRSLSEGITNADTVPTLQKRLQQLPSDLERFFTHILNSVDEIYWDGTAQAFQMALTAVHSLPLWVFSVLDEHNDGNLASTSLGSFTQEEINLKTGILGKRLNARCKGLLEVKLPESGDYPGLHRVDFLHRTARDFLRAKSVESLLLSRQRVPFDSDYALCKGFLLQMKQLHISTSTSPYATPAMLDTVLKDFMHYAFRLEKRGLGPPVELLDECLQVLTEASSKSPSMGRFMFYPYVIRQGLLQYLRLRLSTDANLLRSIGGQPLLSIALTSTSRHVLGSRYDYDLNPAVVDLLLSYGACPNQPFIRPLDPDGTVWKDFITFLQRFNPPLDPGTKLQTIRSMLESDADPDIVVDNSNLDSIIPTLFGRSETKLLAHMIADIRKELRGKACHAMRVFIITNRINKEMEQLGPVQKNSPVQDSSPQVTTVGRRPVKSASRSKNQNSHQSSQQIRIPRRPVNSATSSDQTDYQSGHQIGIRRRPPSNENPSSTGE